MKTLKQKTNEQIFTDYYLSCFPDVAVYVRKSGGTLDDAKDVFQDAIITLYEKKQKSPESLLILDENSYLSGIARKIWLKKVNRENKINLLSLSETHAEPQTEKESKVSDNIFQFVEQTGKKCLELLKGFYYDKLSMKDIAKKFKFSGERSATVQKHKCIEKIRDTINTNFMAKEDFYE